MTSSIAKSLANNISSLSNYSISLATNTTAANNNNERRVSNQDNDSGLTDDLEDSDSISKSIFFLFMF